MTKTDTNEFALFNNGLTLLSDETYINERIGQKNKAQLMLKNPQIINGGQTAYTLSRIYEENNPEETEKFFKNKEVLFKVITLLDPAGRTATASQKLELIDRISAATNRQTAVLPADRHSNDQVNKDVQKIVFERYGILYERKRGEFVDGLNKKYILSSQVIERNLFFRIFYSANGNIHSAIQKRIFQRGSTGVPTLSSDVKSLDNFYYGFLIYGALVERLNKKFISKQQSLEILGKIYAFVKCYESDKMENFTSCIKSNLDVFEERWKEFVDEKAKNAKYHLHVSYNRRTGVTNTEFNIKAWMRSTSFQKDIETFFGVNLAAA